MAKPLIYQITNFVSAQLQADVTALLGGAAIMSRSVDEAEEIARGSDALLINIGTPDDRSKELFRAAVRGARDIPKTLDLTGYGFSRYRTALADMLLSDVTFSIIKGNEAEIAALSGARCKPRGVSCDEEFDLAAENVRLCAQRYGAVVFSTGTIDYLSDGSSDIVFDGGSSMIRDTSGIGCALGCAAALFSSQTAAMDASRRALSLFRNAAAEAAGESGGPYSFRTSFLDRLAALNDADGAL